MKKIIVFFIIFSFVNQIKYSFLPLNTMLLLGIMGLLLFLYNNQMKRERHYQHLVKSYVFCFIPLLISTIPATIVNFTDFYFIRDLILIPIIYIFSGYFVAFLIRNTYETANLQKFVELYVSSIVLQCFLSLVFILFPDIQLLLMKLVSYSELQENKLGGAIGLRAIGFGIEFFGAGILMCIALTLCISQFFENLTFSKKLYYILSYVFILCIGTLLARTTLIGAAISLIVFIGLRIIKSFKFTFKLSIFFVLAFCFFLVIKDSLIDYLYNIDNNYLTFGLEIFLNQIEGNGFESQSTSSLFTMYETLPDNIFTWIFGDGYFRDLHDPLFGYYKNIDVGYIRIIFATGIIGLLCYLICNIQILNKAFNSNFFLNRNKIVYLKLSLMFLFLVLMFKGLIVIIPLFAFLSFSKQ